MYKTSALLHEASFPESRDGVSILTAFDREEFKAHLLRLARPCRQARFGNDVNDNFLIAYAKGIDFKGCMIFAYWAGGSIRGTAELISFKGAWPSDCELAFTVECERRRQGVGSALADAAISGAKARGVEHIYATCSAKNRICLALLASIATKLERGSNGVFGRAEFLDLNGQLMDTNALHREQSELTMRFSLFV